jgi:hypothetical protein
LCNDLLKFYQNYAKKYENQDGEQKDFAKEKKKEFRSLRTTKVSSFNAFQAFTIVLFYSTSTIHLILILKIGSILTSKPLSLAHIFISDFIKSNMNCTKIFNRKLLKFIYVKTLMFFGYSKRTSLKCFTTFATFETCQDNSVATFRNFKCIENSIKS